MLKLNQVIILTLVLIVQKGCRALCNLDQPYKKEKRDGKNENIEEVHRCSGALYNTELVEMLMKIFEKEYQ